MAVMQYETVLEFIQYKKDDSTLVKYINSASSRTVYGLKEYGSDAVRDGVRIHTIQKR